jgi:hypothetical protein
MQAILSRCSHPHGSLLLRAAPAGSTSGELTPTDHGVLVHTEESWEGEAVRAQPETLQQALDASLRAWLDNLKRAAERAAG